jgi:molecular chaperone GrpE
MMDNNEDRDKETTPIEEVQIPDEAQQLVKESIADSDKMEVPDEPVSALELEPSPEQEVAEMKDRLLRALADVENTRRRAKRDVEDARKYAASNFAKDLLTVSDNLRRALDTMSEETRDGDDNVKNLVLGIEMVEKELLTAFERQGVSRVDPLGELFDHNYHQAIFEKPDTEYPNGTVAEVMQAGYVMHDRLLRPAMVAVAKGGSEEKSPPSEADPVDTSA